jgi:hypothetical protein
LLVPGTARINPLIGAAQKAEHFEMSSGPPTEKLAGSASPSGSQLPSLGVVPVVNVLLDLILGETVAFLNFALKLISLTVYGGKVVVGEISPLFLDLSLHLLPVTLNAIPVHFELPVCVTMLAWKTIRSLNRSGACDASSHS